MKALVKILRFLAIVGNVTLLVVVAGNLGSPTDDVLISASALILLTLNILFISKPLLGSWTTWISLYVKRKTLEERKKILKLEEK